VGEDDAGGVGHAHLRGHHDRRGHDELARRIADHGLVGGWKRVRADFENPRLTSNAFQSVFSKEELTIEMQCSTAFPAMHKPGLHSSAPAGLFESGGGSFSRAHAKPTDRHSGCHLGPVAK